MVSIVQYYGEQNSKCGYCKGITGSKSHGMHAYRLDCDDYQDLIDRGWRRCGNYCYKFQNEKTCCPCYTIKCDIQEFKLSKSHKRILKRMNRFLRDGKREHQQENNVHAPQDCKDGEGDTDGGGSNDLQPTIPDKVPSVIDVDNITAIVEASPSQQQQQQCEDAANTLTATVTTVDQPKSNGGNLQNKSPPRKKAKQMRRERRQIKLDASGATTSQRRTKIDAQEKTLLDFVNSTSDSDKHKLQIILVPAGDITHTCNDLTLALYRKYQLVIHNDNPARLTLASMKRFLVKSPLKLRWVHVDDDNFQRTLTESYALYMKYQSSIHNDPPKQRKDYLDFLQVSPLKHDQPKDGPPMGYGSFHQQYWLDDKLIAVGVIDILPRCVSSVYFFYDPDYSFLSLGTYGSLREIDFVQQLAESVPALKYYYMGFYIHSCPKMRYKGKLSASYLLCPETYAWMPLTDEIRTKLDKCKYQRLNPDSTAQDEDEFLREHLNDVTLLMNAKACISYERYVQITGSNDQSNEIMEYAQLVGRECALRMIYVN